MTDKVQKIREEVARIQLYTQSEVLKQVLDYIDEVQKEEIPPKFPLISQKCAFSSNIYTDEDRKVLCDGCEEECEYTQKEEPVSKVYTFKAIPRLLDMIQPSDRAKTYIAKLADSLDEQGYHTDAKIVRESIKIMNGEKVAMATMDEEPVSEEFGEIILEGTNFNKSWYAHPELAFKAGAKWQKANLWKPADGDDLPEIDREVIVLIQDYPDDKDHLRVAFAHRPNKYAKFWNSNLGEEQVVEIEGYDKGGWNIPNVKWWLDCLMPKEIEEL